MQKYLIERSFLQSVLSRLLVEINLRYDTFFQNILDAISKTKSKKVKEKIEAIKNKIEDNEVLKEIEIPIFKNIVFIKKNTNSKKKEKQSKNGQIG